VITDLGKVYRPSEETLTRRANVMENKVMIFTYPGKHVPVNKDLNGISRKKITASDFIVFTLRGKEFRVIKGVNGNPLWLAKDVCVYFGVMDHDRRISRIGKDMKKLVSITDSMGKTHKDTIVNEPGVYTLMFECKPGKTRGNGREESDIAMTEHVEKMVDLRRWVGDTVFPAILTFPEKLRAYADELERRERAEKQLALAPPKNGIRVLLH
jgi:prophage antirepressor-like protein